MSQKYYNGDRNRAIPAHYHIAIGERSDGKTYDVCLKDGLINYWTSGCVNQLAYVRRWDEDITASRGAATMQSLVKNGDGENMVEKVTGGEWNDIEYRGRRWYLARYDADLDKKVCDSTPFAFAFSLSAGEHDKSAQYPNVTTIFFDEFISRSIYLRDEFIAFMNLISTIKRKRTNVTIWMCGNTVNPYCPYFNEMGLSNVKKQKQGTIETYQYGNSDLKVAVEYCASTGKKSKDEANVYFAFNNPRLDMITTGVWEMAIYPHLPYQYTPADVLAMFFIVFDGDTYHCDIVDKANSVFIYVHKKTTPLRDPDNDLIFSTGVDPRPNWRQKITAGGDAVTRRIAWFFQMGKVFYQDNAVGEGIRNYLEWCKHTA